MVARHGPFGVARPRHPYRATLPEPSPQLAPSQPGLSGLAPKSNSEIIYALTVSASSNKILPPRTISLYSSTVIAMESIAQGKSTHHETTQLGLPFRLLHMARLATLSADTSAQDQPSGASSSAFSRSSLPATLLASPILRCPSCQRLVARASSKALPPDGDVPRNAHLLMIHRGLVARVNSTLAPHTSQYFRALPRNAHAMGVPSSSLMRELGSLERVALEQDVNVCRRSGNYVVAYAVRGMSVRETTISQSEKLAWSQCIPSGSGDSARGKSSTRNSHLS